MEQALLEHRGLGVTPGTSPRRGLSLGGSADTATSDLLRVPDEVLCVTRSQNGCWNQPQELGATDIPSSLTCQTPGSPKVAGGIRLYSTAQPAFQSCFLTPHEEGAQRLAIFIPPFFLAKRIPVLFRAAWYTEFSLKPAFPSSLEAGIVVVPSTQPGR